MIEKIADELRCPALLLNGSETNPTAIVAISPLIVPDKGPLLIAVSLEKQESWHIINKISSCYGREHFNPFINKGTGEWEEGYIRRQIKQGKLIAVNKEKAQHILRPAGLQLPLGESYIGFNNSISHSLDSVKGLDEKYLNKILDNLHKKYPATTGRGNMEEKMEDNKSPNMAIEQVTLTAEHCFPESKNTDYTNQLILVDSSFLSPEYRTAEFQIVNCTHGNGARPDAHGTSVFGTELLTGDSVVYARHQILGIADPARLPEWAKQKLGMEKDVATTGRGNEVKNMEEIKMPKLADIDEAVGEYKAVDIQEDIAKQMLDIIKDMPPMTKEQHKAVADTCQDFDDNSHKIRAEFTALQSENEKLRTELEATKAELAEARKEIAIYKEAIAQGITIDVSKDIDQYAYLVTEVLPENIANIEQKLADNAKTESAIRESDYNFKDLVALIYSSKAYTEQTLPLEFVAKLEQSIEKLGYVSGETYGKVQTEHEGVKTELAGAKIQIAELTEINEQLREENRELNVRVVELLDINENLRHIPQKEMTGLSPEIQKLTMLNEKPDMKELPGMLEKVKEIIGISEHQRNERGGDER
jgi:hypothetical protein